jgi:hypothetical protein
MAYSSIRVLTWIWHRWKRSWIQCSASSTWSPYGKVPHEVTGNSSSPSYLHRWPASSTELLNKIIVIFTAMPTPPLLLAINHHDGPTASSVKTICSKLHIIHLTSFLDHQDSIIVWVSLHKPWEHHLRHKLQWPAVMTPPLTSSAPNQWWV